MVQRDHDQEYLNASLEHNESKGHLGEPDMSEDESTDASPWISPSQSPATPNPSQSPATPKESSMDLKDGADIPMNTVDIDDKDVIGPGNAAPDPAEDVSSNICKGSSTDLQGRNDTSPRSHSADRNDPIHPGDVDVVASDAF